MTRAQIAQIFGKAERTIGLWHDHGLPKPTKTEGRQFVYDPREVLQWALANGKIEVPAASRGAEDAEAPDYYEQRARWMKARADTAERELAKMDGRLLDAEDVLSHWKDGILTLRSRLLAVPTKLAPMVAGVTPAEAEHYIKNEIHAALTEIAEHGALPKENDYAD